MNIVVCVKYVPDATADRRFEDDNTVDRVGVDGLLSELDEYAVEQALQLKEKSENPEDTKVTALCVGPEKAADAVRKALQMGADEGVHVTDEAIAWAGQFSGAASYAVRAAKESIDRGLEVDLETGLEIERHQFASLFATPDRAIGMRSFIDKGPGKAEFEGR